jgi:fatty acid synthase subunit beta, fungi type
LASSPQLQSPTPEEIWAAINHHLPTLNKLVSPVELQRGQATIPLPGVNVPFHSSYLREGIDTYRQYLKNKIQKEDIAVDRLVGRFVPNLTGKPFSISRDYVEEVTRATGSKILHQLLEGWAR